MAFDATPLLGTRTGVGKYVERLSGELCADSDAVQLRAVAFSLRRRSALRTLPAAIRAVHFPAPARLLHKAWLRGDVPRGEWLSGRVDVFHGTNFVLPPLRRAAGVVTVHDLTFLRFPELVDTPTLAYRTLTPRAIAQAGAVLTATRAIAQEIEDAFAVPEHKIWVTPLGVDAAWYQPIPPQPPGLPSEYLVAVSTVEPRKGLDVLMSAYRKALGEDKSVPPLVLVGPPGWGPALDTTGIPADRIVPTGYIDDDSLRALVGRATALVFPSRYEGFGLPPLEALAAGTPVVASDLPVTREVLGSHARLVPPGDAAALADALLTLLADPPTPASIARGRQHAAGFTWRRCAEQTLAAYRAAAAARAVR